jgi:release factor glutamine methyltransferase
MRSLKKKTFFADLTFDVYEEVYEPAEDTFLIADILNRTAAEGETVLDVGTGCGILAVVASKKAKRVVATDVNPHAVECAKRNAKANRASSKVQVRLGDLFEPISETEEFGMIVFNAPYLPSTPGEHRCWKSRAWAGGPTGRRIIDRFIKDAPNHLKFKGRILLVQSTLSDVEETLRKFQETGLDAKVVAEKKAAFETIVVIQASHLSQRSI